MQSIYRIKSQRKQINVFLILSLIILCLTTGGWSMLAAWPIYFVLHIILLIRFNLIFRTLNRNSISEISISKNRITIGTVLFILAILFNVGDCGDNPGPSAFIFRLFLCGTSSNAMYDILTGFSFVILMTYFIYIHLTFENILTKNLQNIQVSFFTKLYKVVMIILLLGPIWAFAYSYYDDYKRQHRSLAPGEVRGYFDGRPTEYGLPRTST